MVEAPKNEPNPSEFVVKGKKGSQGSFTNLEKVDPDAPPRK